MDIDLELIGRLLPEGRDSRAAAARLEKLWPAAPPLALAERATIAAQRRAMVVSLGTGLVIIPALLVPAALIDMVLLIRIEAHLAGAIGALLDPGSLEDEGRRLMDIYAMLFPDLLLELDAQRAGGSVAVPASAGLAEDHRMRLRRRIGKGLGSGTLKLVAKYVGLRLAQRSPLSRAVPLVGAAVGATLGWTTVRAVGERAMTYHLWRQRRTPGSGSWTATAPSPLPEPAP